MIFSPQRTLHSASGQGSHSIPAATPPRRRLGINKGELAAFFALTVSLLAAGRLDGHFPLSLFLFFTFLAVPAEALPVTGPRGRRINISDGVSLAALLLLPPMLAPLPLLIVGGLHGFARRTRAAQQEAWAKTLCLATATLAGGWVYYHVKSSAHGFTLRGALTAFVVYGLLLIGGRTGLLRTSRRSWRLDLMALTASLPPALLMARLWPALGLLSLGTATALLGLLLLVAHFGFETGLLREQVRAMERLSAVSLAQDNRPRLINLFLQLSGALVSSHRVSLWLTDHSHLRLDLAARIQTDWSEADQGRTQPLIAEESSVRFDEGLVGRVAERQVPLIVRDGLRDTRAAAVERQDWPETPFSLLLLPLMADGETVGVVQFERDDPHPFTPRDLDRMRALVNQAAATLVNAQRHHDVTNQAVTDSLTGLFNRRHVQAALENEQRRALRYDRPLSVVMLDIDTFKSYNDTYGHTQGDVLIKMVAGLLRANVRAVDTVGRYGGEEFIIVMPETTKEEAGYTAERLRQAVASTIFPGFADDPEMAVFKTISLGVATMPQDAGDIEMLVTMADQSLYQAKRGGRNRAVLAEALAEGAA